VHNCFEGGGFGRGGMHGELEQAVTVAKALGGRPVKVLRPFPDFAGKGRFAFGEQLTLRPLHSRVT